MSWISKYYDPILGACSIFLLLFCFCFSFFSPFSFLLSSSLCFTKYTSQSPMIKKSHLSRISMVQKVVESKYVDVTISIIGSLYYHTNERSSP